MKQLLLFFLLISIASKSQDFKKVDSLVLEYPRFSKAEDLATKISKDFTSDEDKARAAFYWLAKNIRYNLKELYNPKQRSYNFSYSSEKERIQKIHAQTATTDHATDHATDHRHATDQTTAVRAGLARCLTACESAGSAAASSCTRA